jgi:hypothetical protein
MLYSNYLARRCAQLFSLGRPSGKAGRSLFARRRGISGGSCSAVIAGNIGYSSDHPQLGAIADHVADWRRSFEGGSWCAQAVIALPPQQNKDNGILTGLELRALNLEHVELVTLTACQSALGIQSPGEGVLGIQRAFQLAGAHSTIASLWSVPIGTTNKLMEEFYDNLWNKKLSRVESLRQAQLKIMREGGKEVAQEPQLRVSIENGGEMRFPVHRGP